MGGKGRGLGQDGSNRQYRPSLSHPRATPDGALSFIGVDNHLLSWVLTPIFALYPQIFPSLARNWSLKDRFRPQPVDKYVENF